MEFSSIARLPVIRNEGPFHSYFTFKNNWKNTLVTTLQRQYSRNVNASRPGTLPVHHPECSLLSVVVYYQTSKRSFLPLAVFDQGYVDMNLLIAQLQLLVLAKRKRALSVRFLIESS